MIFGWRLKSVKLKVLISYLPALSFSLGVRITVCYWILYHSAYSAEPSILRDFE